MTPRSLTGYSAVPGQGLLQISSHHGPVLISLLRVPFLCTEGIDCKLSWVNKSATDLLDTTVRAHWYLWHVKAYPNAPSISKISIIPRLQTTHNDCFQFTNTISTIYNFTHTDSILPTTDSNYLQACFNLLCTCSEYSAVPSPMCGNWLEYNLRCTP